MNVDSIRVSDVQPTARTREGSDAARGGFDDLFGSLISGPSSARVDEEASTRRGERPEPKSAEPRTERASSRKMREKKDSRVGAQGSDDPAQAPREAAEARRTGESSEASRAEERESDASDGEAAREEAVEQQAAAAAADPTPELSARSRVGIPEWLALAQAESAAAADEAPLEVEASARLALGTAASAPEAGHAQRALEADLAAAPPDGLALDGDRGQDAALEVLAAAQPEGDQAGEPLDSQLVRLPEASARAAAREAEAALVDARATGVAARDERAANGEAPDAVRAVDAGTRSVSASDEGKPGSEGGHGGSGDEPQVALPSPVRAEQAQRASGDESIASPTNPASASGPPSAEAASAARADAVGQAAALRPGETPVGVETTARVLPAAGPDAITFQADWLATRGGGTARIVLHPPELGEIAIRVSVRQQGVEVVMVAQTALAHSMAEDQGDRLAQAFASRDLRLEQFEVRRGDPSDASSTGQFASSDAGARERERAQEERGAAPGASDRGARGRGVAGGEPAMVQPRPASTERPSGVDLRI